MNDKIKSFAALILILGLISSCSTVKNLNKSDNKISIEIMTDKVNAKSSSWISLPIKIINKSKEDITILVPKRDYFNRLDFFTVNMECQMPAIIEEVEAEETARLRYNSEIITIKAKSEKEFLLWGTAYDLICDSKTINVKVNYNSTEVSNRLKRLNNRQKKNAEQIIGKLSQLNISSPTTKLVLQ